MYVALEIEIQRLALANARCSVGCEIDHPTLIDLECGWNAGVKKSILVRTGHGAVVQTTSASRINNSVVVDNITEAAEWIVRER